MNKNMLASLPGLVAGFAQAQSVTPPAVLEEIVVTVRRQAEPAADVPMFVTSHAGGTLERSGVEGMLELAQVTPSLVVSRFGTLTQPALRGVTARLGENSVATYVDGFYVPNAVSLDAQFNHVERVDVLKGPQGTLFGRNATGGAILITTRDPSREPTLAFSAGAESLDGDVGGRTFGLYASGALGAAAAADVSVSRRESNGWIYDLRGGSPLNEQTRQDVRAKLVYEPAATLRVAVAAEHGMLEDPTTTGALSFYSHRLFPAVLPPNSALPSPATPNVVAVSKPPRSTAEWTAGYAKVEWSNGAVRFASLTSYRTDDSEVDFDFDGSAAVNPPLPGGTHLAWELGGSSLQQEVTFASVGERRVEWLAGLHVFDDELKQIFLPGNVVAMQNEAVATADTLALSVFADFSYAVNEALTLFAGARHSWEEKDGMYAADLPPAAFEADVDFDDFTPRVAVRYDLSPAASLYASLSEGFKSGFVSAAANGVSTTDPESLTAFELGYKARRARLAFDVATYVYDWENIQVARFEPTAGGNVVQNAAAATVHGVEAQAEWLASPRLRIRVGAAYTAGEYDDFPNATVTVSANPDDPSFPNNLLPSSQDWSGNATIRTPEWTASLGFAYTWTTRAGDVEVAGNLYYASELAPNSAREHPVTGRLDLTADAHTLVNVGLTWAPGPRWSVTLYGRNLTDELYVLSRDANAFGEYRAYGEPRVIGLKFAFEGE